MKPNVKADFPIFQNYPELVYLDNAATTQKPIAVLDALENFYRMQNANVYRGVYDLSQQATDAYESARQKVQHFINAKKPEEVIFTKGTTQSINIPAYSLGNLLIRQDDEIIISYAEHHSNLVPWQELALRKGAKLKYVNLDEDQKISLSDLAQKISPKTKIVAISHISNVLGMINPVKEIVDMAHDVGAVVAIDGAQAIAHMPVDVQNLDVDFYSFSGHKMLGPTGIGVLYGKREFLDKMEPVEFGGEMISYVEDFKTTWNDLPYKFEGGTPNIAGAIGLGTAVDYLSSIGMQTIFEHDQELINYLRDQLSGELDFKTYGNWNSNQKTGIVSFNLANIHPHDVATILDTQNIAVRAGHHCAQPLMRYCNENSMCRLSTYLYNSKEDIDKFIAAVEYTKEFFKLD